MKVWVIMYYGLGEEKRIQAIRENEEDAIRDVEKDPSDEIHTIDIEEYETS